MLSTKPSLLFNIKKLFFYISRKRKKQIFVLLIFMIFASFFELLSIGAIIPFLGILTSPDIVYQYEFSKPLIDLFQIKASKELILPITIIFISSIIFSAIFRFFLLYFQTKVSFLIGSDISSSIYRKTLYQTYSIHINRNSSSIISIISNKVPYVMFQVITPIITLISSFFMIIVIFLSFALYNPNILFFLVISTSSFYFLLTKLTKSKLKEYSLSVSLSTNEVIKTLQEGLGGIRDILIDGSQEVFCEIFERADYCLKRGQRNISVISGGPRFIIEAIGISMIGLFAFYLTTSQDNGITSAIPLLGALALGAQRTLPLLQQIFLNWASIKGGEASLADVLNLLDQELPIIPGSSNNNKIDFKNEIILKKVSFSYNSSNVFALNNISINIKKGSRFGIIGSTGGGKSTLLDIIMGLQSPTTGELEIDGVTINSDNFKLWQKNIAHVPQNIFLSDNTVAENIAFGIPKSEIDMSRVKNAAIKAKISDLIESYKFKYDTIIGEKGIFLSGGQRQRIGIARAIYKGSDLIILDEATSALDNLTEDYVMEAINSLGEDLTIIIVAHRLSTLKNCDKIIEIKDGKIIKTLNYNDLIN